MAVDVKTWFAIDLQVAFAAQRGKNPSLSAKFRQHVGSQHVPLFFYEI